MTPEELIDQTTVIEEMTKTDNAAKRTEGNRLGGLGGSHTPDEERLPKPDRSTWTNTIDVLLAISAVLLN